jgi:hypothetical protein
MNARASENFLAIARSAAKSVEIPVKTYNFRIKDGNVQMVYSFRNMNQFSGLQDSTVFMIRTLQLHAVQQKVSRFFWPRYIGDDFLLGPNLVSFNRAVVPLLELFLLCKHRFPCNTLTHSINEDLLNIKRKGDPEVSYPLSYVRYH